MTPRQVFKHDLALALGMTVTHLSEEMTESEFRQWQVYARDKMLPARRLEHGMALIPLVIARVMGGNTSMSLVDFMIPDVGIPPKEQTAEEFAAALGGTAIMLGQRRKKKG
jgi:hypothetical protein